MPAIAASATDFPDWVPRPARLYVGHACAGRSLRDLARAERCAPSTVLRHVRRLEARRDDPLLDDALDRLAEAVAPLDPTEEDGSMSAPTLRSDLVDDATLAREGRRILRRLTEPGAFLAVGRGLHQAVVMRETEAGLARIATLPRAVAQAFVLKDWVRCTHAGTVTRYALTEPGRAALARMLSDKLRAKAAARGMAEAASPFLHQQGERVAATIDGPDGAMEAQVNLSESPLGGLARKRDRDGKPFLPLDLVVAGERLREEYERAQMGPRVGQNWERFLTAGCDAAPSGRGPCEGPSDARRRVSEALRALGPGLADVALRVCCLLEGLETAEKRMGWSARSGKIVLRIALQRLRDHYDGPRTA
ncbi:helix-turn-helix domain-containing protein [Jannaschia sp. Os4]|uniref:DUF6456 domain-containing protein n=1 Tax=Jannaschia sp. Os4 TaxID=2807617 RepID=UPI0019396EA8|nr:DUF6456 domain-containing protein [Jannaschia sp. Os4]MBM2577020.1 helix-turn-helix domain-containing protein [Jannaschia sp. Os4]